MSITRSNENYERRTSCLSEDIRLSFEICIQMLCSYKITHRYVEAFMPGYTHHEKNDRPKLRTCHFIQDNSRVAEYTDTLLRQALQGTFPLQGLF